MSSSTTDKKIITLRSSDGVTFEVDENVAVLSGTLKLMTEDGCADNVIPLRNATGKILSKVIEYCKRHMEPVGEDAVPNSEDELMAFNAEFVKVDQEMLFDLISATNCLDVKGLLDLKCKTAADMIKGKTPEEVREFFNIMNDYTPQEEEEVHRKNAWAFE